MKNRYNKRKAFTLVELLIVIVVLSLLFIVLISKVNFATDKAKATGVQVDFKSFQYAFNTVAQKHSGFNTFGWDIGDTNANGKRDSYDEGDVNKDGIQNNGEIWTGHKGSGETWTGIYTLVKPGTTFETHGYDADAIAKLEDVINEHLDLKLQIDIHTDGTITMMNGLQDPWNNEYHGAYISNSTVDKKDQGAIVIYSNGVNGKFGSVHDIAGGILTISIPDNNTMGKDDYATASIYTYVNNRGEVQNVTSGFSPNQAMFIADNSSEVERPNTPDIPDTPDLPDTPDTPDTPEIPEEEEFVDSIVVNSEKPVRDENKVTFGIYPQSEVTNDTLKATLNAKAGEWTESNGMWYTDVENRGNKYRGVRTTKNGETVWFKYELISWTILEKKDGTALVLCDLVIDAMKFDSTDNNYANSDIRAWFNDIFINTAFDELQQAFILETEVDNINSTGYSNPKFTCENTNDKIFLLARVDIKNETYGFVNDGNVTDTARQKQATEYAKMFIRANDPDAGTEDEYNPDNGAWWWIRTPTTHGTDPDRKDVVHRISVDGRLHVSAAATPTGGVVPVMWISFEVIEEEMPENPDTSEHICESICVTCGGCTDNTCNENVCVDKCDCTDVGGDGGNQGGNAGEGNEEPDAVIVGGLYNSNGMQLASWGVLTNVYGLDISKNYSSSTYLTDAASLYSVLANNPSLSTGTKLIVGYEASTYALRSTGVTQIGSYALAGCEKLIDIIVPNSVTTIGANAFQGCTSLTSLTVPFVGYSHTSSGAYLGYWFGANTYSGNTDFVPSSLKAVTITNATQIDNDTFYGCKNITKIILNEGITTIGSNAFYGCTGLVDMFIPSTITSVSSNAFYNCKNLQSIHITNLDNWLKISFKNNAANPMYYANELLLNGNPIVGEVVIPDSVTTIPYYALKNTQITSVVFHDNITSIQEGVFKGCIYLTNFDLNEGLQTIESYAFEECVSIIDVNIPSSVISLGSYAFKSCSGLTNVVLNEGIENIGSGAFEGCTSLVDFIIPNSVKIIESHILKGCTNLTNLTVPFVGHSQIASNVYLGYCFGASTYSGNITYVPNSLKTVTITNATQIKDYTFYRCNNITKIILNEGITTIGSNAFKGCMSLVEVVIPSTITSVGISAFDQCTALTKIVFTGTIEQWNAIAKDSNWNNNVPATEIICSNGTATLS